MAAIMGTFKAVSISQENLKEVTCFRLMDATVLQRHLLNGFCMKLRSQSCSESAAHLASRSCNLKTKFLALISAQPYHIITISNSIPCKRNTGLVYITYIYTAMTHTLNREARHVWNRFPTVVPKMRCMEDQIKDNISLGRGLSEPRWMGREEAKGERESGGEWRKILRGSLCCWESWKVKEQTYRGRVSRRRNGVIE